jgi:hypothetical protein
VKAKTAVSKRPELVPVSDEMKQWSAMLEQELRAWPKVASRPMFGMTAFYHDRAIFAALPRTRALSNPRSILFRFDALPPQLLHRAGKQAGLRQESAFSKGHWLSLVLESEKSLRDALWWLNHAYESAGERKPLRSKRRPPRGG